MHPEPWQKHDLANMLRDNIQDFLVASDMCVVPSVREPLGLVAVEAMAAGTPVVASRVGGLPEIVVDEQNGLLVPPRDPKSLAAAVIRMARDRSLRERLSEQGKQFVYSRFDPDVLTTDIESAYHSLVNWRRRAA